MLAYEDWNVDVGVAAGFPGRAQIGKGMWTMPDRMRAWSKPKPRIRGPVPAPPGSPRRLPPTCTRCTTTRSMSPPARPSLPDDPGPASTTSSPPPCSAAATLSADEIQRELENNAQGILGYVVRWVEQGIGCSKIPDIHDVGLMEDRATLRIASQHIANWLHHGITNRDQVIRTFQKMAAIVDRQNADDPNYRAMAPDFDASLGFRAALDLVFQGRSEPNGYTSGS